MAINERGFSLVEVSLALPVLIIAVSGVFLTVYLCIAQAWLKDAGEEAALCVAEKVGLRDCKREFREKTKTVLPVGEFVRLSIEKYESLVIVKYAYQAAQITLENEISLRLPVSKKAVGK